MGIIIGHLYLGMPGDLFDKFKRKLPFYTIRNKTVAEKMRADMNRMCLPVFQPGNDLFPLIQAFFQPCTYG